MRISDWSSDVCSSDLIGDDAEAGELHHPKTFFTKYIWSQDHKVIAIQYSLTAIAIGLVALVLSVLMRLQLGFPDTFSFITPENYLQHVSMHGMIMVVYLLTALFLGGRSEEHTSELQSLMRISYAVF